VSASGGGGLVKSRDFVNLRCWKLIKNGRVVDNYNLNTSLSKLSQKIHSSDGDNESSDEDGGNNNDIRAENSEKRNRTVKIVNEKALKKSASDNVLNESVEDGGLSKLSKSLGATEISCVTSEDDEPFSDAQTEIVSDQDKCCFVSAAMSIDYQLYPPTAKYIRGDNIISCWAMRPVSNDENASIFEWVLCIDLKGSLPKYVLNTAFVSLMNDYMVHLRSRIQQLTNQSSNCA
jgi:hypothetical protein